MRCYSFRFAPPCFRWLNGHRLLGLTKCIEYDTVCHAAIWRIFIFVRKERGLTQEELSKKSGISRPNLSSMEQGRRDVTLGTLRRIAYALNLQPGFLADGLPPVKIQSARLSRTNLDSITDYLLGRKARLTDYEMKIANLIRACAKRKLGISAPSGRRLPRTAREEKKGWRELKFLLSDNEIKNLMSRIEKKSAVFNDPR